MPWTRDRVETLIGRLQLFRNQCRATTLAEVQTATHSPYHLLVSCVISLRTRDEVTHVASQRLLEQAPDPRALAKLDEGTVASLIYPAGFYRTKAGQLRQIAARLASEHDGHVPPDLGQLLALPGVGRKTANLVLGLGFGIPAVCVDTHVHRISNRLGLVRTRTPEATERSLKRHLPRQHWIDINDLLVTFGQNQCHPTSPRCSTCPLADLCRRIGVRQSR
jgi:endonuclease-3